MEETDNEISLVTAKILNGKKFKAAIERIVTDNGHPIEYVKKDMARGIGQFLLNEGVLQFSNVDSPLGEKLRASVYAMTREELNEIIMAAYKAGKLSTQIE